MLFRKHSRSKVPMLGGTVTSIVCFLLKLALLLQMFAIARLLEISLPAIFWYPRRAFSATWGILFFYEPGRPGKWAPLDDHHYTTILILSLRKRNPLLGIGKAGSWICERGLLLCLFVGRFEGNCAGKSSRTGGKAWGFWIPAQGLCLPGPWGLVVLLGLCLAFFSCYIFNTLASYIYIYPPRAC